MPRNAARRWSIVVCALSAGCVFDASYQSGHTTCSDGQCPSNLVCSDHVCVASGTGPDAAPAHDAAPAVDAHVAALDCADPGALASGVAVSGSTGGRTNMVGAMCGDMIMNGPDAVYSISLAASQSLALDLLGTANLVTYVVPAASCAPPPSTPQCLDNVYAVVNAAAITIPPPGAGTYYIVVDSPLAAGSGSYTLTVTID